MKIQREQALILRIKLTEYLLVPRKRGDKSKWLEGLSFTQDNVDQLEEAIWHIIEENDAELDRQDQYGDYYRVTGELKGIDKSSQAIIVWIMHVDDDMYRFVTMKPGERS